MRRVRIGIIGAGGITEWAILPALSGPDALAPPDSGAWWGRRPGAHADIAYQPPARPEVVALADADYPLAQRVAQTARIGAVYGDWRALWREMRPDALVCAASPALHAEIALELSKGTVGAGIDALAQMWVYGPLAPTAHDVAKIERHLKGRPLAVWPARPLARATAHRAARQLLERGEIGPVAALHLRWGLPLHPSNGSGVSSERENGLSLAASSAALDCLLAFAAPAILASSTSDVRAGASDDMEMRASARPLQVLASEHQGATTLWLRCADGVNATALFAAAESWSAPLPRLEICGTEGRSIICEAGRRLWLHRPREAARLLEPPGLATHVSAASVAGVAEDLKAFLAACAHPGTDVSRPQAWTAAQRALLLLEAAGRSLQTGAIVEVPEGGGDSPTPAPVPETSSRTGALSHKQQAPSVTLPLQL